MNRWQVLPAVVLPGMIALAGIGYLLRKRPEVILSTAILPLLIVVGYCALALSSSNREVRFVFAGVIALPYLIGLLVESNVQEVPRNSAALAAALAFFGIVIAALPMLHRPDRQSIHKSEEVLDEAAAFNAKRILLATDSATLNDNLLRLANVFSSPGSPFEMDSLAWRALAGTPVQDDLKIIQESDLIVFQDKADIDKGQTDARVPQYEQFLRDHVSNTPVAVVDGMRLYITNKLHR
jgi:hypothetical protein